MLPTHRPPTHPGDMLLKEFLEPLGVSQVEADSAFSVGRLAAQDVAACRDLLPPVVPAPPDREYDQ
jgi:antitoxin HigA-1